MNDATRILRAEVILLSAISASLAVAGAGWLYFILMVAASGVGWILVHQRGSELLKPWMARVIVVLAFTYTVFKYTDPETLSILALSRFMMIVCIVKLVQKQNLRDQAQLLMLALLLLVITSIVSDNVILPTVLLIYCGVGVPAFIRYYMVLEAERVRRRNEMIWHGPADEGGVQQSIVPFRSLAVVALMMSAVSLVFGVVLFVLSPRFGGVVLAHTQSIPGSQVMTGLSNRLDLRSSGTIRQSDRPVMRVMLRNGDGSSVNSPSPLYARANAFVQYQRLGLEGSEKWEWTSTASNQSLSRYVNSIRIDNDEGSTVLLPELAWLPESSMVEYEFLVDAVQQSTLFSCYPAVEMRSASLPRVGLYQEADLLKVEGLNNKAVRYTLRTPSHLDETSVAALGRRYGGDGLPVPVAIPPVPALPRDSEIRAFVRTYVMDVASPIPTEKQGAFVSRLETVLRSQLFTYTLKQPSFSFDDEPVSRFLLESRSGHCEYYASAMAIICQMYGVPARVIGGYCSDEYNELGQFYVVRQQNAHAWVEVFLPGEDWVTIDPTPSGSFQAVGTMHHWLLGCHRMWDYLQFEWSSWVVAYGSDQRAKLFGAFTDWLRRPVRDETTLVGAVVAFVRELFGWRLELTARERVIYWGFALLAFTLLICVLYVVGLMLWRISQRLARLVAGRSVIAVHRKGAEFYHRFCRCLSELGIERADHQTAAEFAADCARRYPALTPAPALVDAYYAVAFGGYQLSSLQRQDIEQFLGTLKGLDAQALESAL